MKKLVKFVMGAAAVAGTACGVVYLLKKVFGLDLFNKDADDDDDFDNGFDDGFSDIDDDENEEADDREYVTLDMEGEKDTAEEAQEKEPAAAETVAE